jgi:hypothetical protein
MDSVNPSDNHNAPFRIPRDGGTAPLLRAERPPAIRAGAGGAPPQHDQEAGGGLHHLPGQHTHPRHPGPVQEESQVSHLKSRYLVQCLSADAALQDFHGRKSGKSERTGNFEEANVFFLGGGG